MDLEERVGVGREAARSRGGTAVVFMYFVRQELKKEKVDALIC